MFQKFLSLVILTVFLAGCTSSTQEFRSQVQQGDVQEPELISVSALVQPGQAQPTTQPQNSALPEQEASVPSRLSNEKQAVPAAEMDLAVPDENGEPEIIGPDKFPTGVNSLTGLPVNNQETLNYSPALVSITNFPVSARPQAGLSFSPFVFEMYIGEGMTRYLALFYGDYPEKSTDSEIALADDRIGPVRSGRLPYESLRKLYSGFLVMASGSPNVKANLNSYANVWGSDTGDINSAMIPATKLQEIAQKNPDRVNTAALSGLSFQESAPAEGQAAEKVWIPFSFLNQVIWMYDSASESYLRYQDNADGETFIQATDRLNNEPLTYENVVVLFAPHQAQRETLIDIDFMYIDRLPALLFRDGKMYEIFWTTANGEYEKKTGKLRPIRFIDAEGNPFPLKPGQTWVEIVQSFTRYNETVDSELYSDMKTKVSPGSGNWVVHFYPTVPER